MKKFSRHVICAAASLAALGTPLLARAESTVATGAAANLSTTARIDFSVVVPKFVSLQIGTAGVNNVDLITFTVPGLTVGNGTAVAGVGGDLGLGVVTAAVKGNNGNITLSSTTSGAMNDGNVAETLSYAQISTVAAAKTVTLPVLQAPALGDGVTNSITVNATNRVVNSDARWTFSYLNTAVPAAGTYGGANVNNGRVTYTATVP
jgi:hypothetical protein